MDSPRPRSCISPNRWRSSSRRTTSSSTAATSSTSTVTRASFALDTGVLDDLRPERGFAPDARAELFRRAGTGFQALALECFLHFRQREHFQKVAVEPVHDRLGG